MQSAVPGVVAFDDNGKIVGWNRAAELLLGYSAKEIIGSDIQSLRSEELRAVNGASVDGSFDSAFRHRDGGLVKVRSSTSRTEGVERFIQVFWVEPEGLSPESVRRGELHFRQLVESLPHPTFAARGDGTCEFVNARFIDYTGRPASALHGRGWTETIHPNDRAGILSTWENSRVNQRPIRRGCRIRGRDGAYRWFDMRIEPVFDGAGRLIKWVGTLIDIDDETFEALRRERDRLERIVHTAPGVIFALKRSPEGALSMPFTSARITEIYGVNVDFLSGDFAAVLRYVHPADLGGLEATIEESATSLLEWRHEYRVIHPEKGQIWIEGRAVPKREVDGSILWHGFFSDVTARKRDEEEIRDSRERLILALEGARMGTFVFDVERNVVAWDDAAPELFGRTTEEMKLVESSSLMTFVHEDDRANLEWEYERAFEGDADELAVEFRFRRRDSEIRWMSTRAHVDRSAAGRPLRLAGVCIDITEQRNTELALRARDQELRQLAASIREVFWLTDVSNGQLLYVSPAFDEIWGRPREGLYETPQGWLDLDDLHPDDRERVKKAALTQSTGAYNEEYRIVRPDGTTRWIRDRAFPVTDERGAVIRIAGVAEDITERRDLEHQLRQTQKMESLGMLAGGVAHDFNNLLTIIMACVDEMNHNISPDDPNREPLVEAGFAVERATSLTRDLLAFSRRQIHSPQLLDLNSVVVEAERMLARILGEDVVLQTRLATQLRPVMIDPGQWASVLVNLAVNSRHAMPKGGTLAVRTEDVVIDDKRPRGLPLMPAGRYSMLEVADTGSGFSPEIAKRIFEPFFSTKTAGKGTGLGLAVVHGIVQQSGGFIDVSSEPGVGTVFRIYLPALSGAPTSERASQGPELAGTETVLLVEDEAAVRSAAVRSLEARGFDVLPAADAEEALRVLGERAGAVDILVTDVVLPKMDGRSLVAVVGERYPHVMVLYTSGYASDDVDRYGVSPTEDAFLSKPYTPRGLVRKLRQILDAKRGPPSRSL